MIRGDVVTIRRRVRNGTNAYNEPLYETASETISNVLVDTCRSNSGAVELDAERPESDVVGVTFHFPKGYDRSLKGCSIEWMGGSYRVKGDPVPIPEQNCPGKWNMPVRAVRVDG